MNWWATLLDNWPIAALWAVAVLLFGWWVGRPVTEETQCSPRPLRLVRLGGSLCRANSPECSTGAATFDSCERDTEPSPEPPSCRPDVAMTGEVIPRGSVLRVPDDVHVYLEPDGDRLALAPACPHLAYAVKIEGVGAPLRCVDCDAELRD